MVIHTDISSLPNFIVTFSHSTYNFAYCDVYTHTKVGLPGAGVDTAVATICYSNAGIIYIFVVAWAKVASMCENTM